MLLAFGQGPRSTFKTCQMKANGPLVNITMRSLSSTASPTLWVIAITTVLGVFKPGNYVERKSQEPRAKSQVQTILFF